MIWTERGNRLFYIEWLPTVAGAARIHGPEGVTAASSTGWAANGADFRRRYRRTDRWSPGSL